MKKKKYNLTEKEIELIENTVRTDIGTNIN